tara:strand:+ start:678 stop:1424 length:747 start_codon:yes stop_codon:yes gene_type:complete
MSSTIQVDKITDIGGNTMLESNGSGTFTSSLPAPTSGIAASAIDSGTIATARLGSGTASSSTFLRGDQTYAEAGGTFIEIAEANVTSNVGSYFFSNVFSSTYDSYLLQIRVMKFASDQTPQMRFTTDTGTTENSSSYHYWSYYGLNVTGSEVRGNGNGDTKILFTSGTDADSSSDGGISGEIRFFNPFANDSRSAVTTSQFTYRDDNNTYVSVTGGGVLSNSSPRYGFVLFGNSNIALLKATLYGIVK